MPESHKKSHEAFQTTTQTSPQIETRFDAATKNCSQGEAITISGKEQDARYTQRQRRSEQVSRTGDQAISRIERYFDIGKQLLIECEYWSGRAKLDSMEKKPKLPEGIAGRYRTLANQEIGYSEEEMKSLFKMFRDGGRALTVTHLLRLITVKDRKKRS